MRVLYIGQTFLLYVFYFYEHLKFVIVTAKLFPINGIILAWKENKIAILVG